MTERTTLLRREHEDGLTVHPRLVGSFSDSRFFLISTTSLDLLIVWSNRYFYSVAYPIEALLSPLDAVAAIGLAEQDPSSRRRVRCGVVAQAELVGPQHTSCRTAE